MRVLCLAGALLCCLCSVASADGVVVAITPGDSVVQPGDEFELHLEVTAPGAELNGYDAIIGYDPNALTFLQQAPLSLQEGAYMKTACGLTFHLFSAAGDSLSISHSLLCGNPPVFLTGPGVLYKLRFRAALEMQITHVEIRFVQFYRAGVFVDLTSATDAVIGIGTPTTDTSPPPLSAQMQVWASPNPFNPRTTLHLHSAVSGQQNLSIWDSRGRLVRRFATGHFAAGRRQVLWDGRSDRDETLASGVYFVMLESGGKTAATRVVLMK